MGAKALPTCNNQAQHILKLKQMDLKDDNKIDTTTNSTEPSPEYNWTVKGTTGIDFNFSFWS